MRAPPTRYYISERSWSNIMNPNSLFVVCCAVIEPGICDTVNGTFLTGPRPESHVVMESIAHIRTRHPGVRLHGTLADDYRRESIRGGGALYYNLEGRLLALLQEVAPIE